MKAELKDLYHRYCKDLVKGSAVDADLQKEYTRQRDYLERTLASLQRKVVKDQQIHRVDNARIMTENIVLIKYVE